MGASVVGRVVGMVVGAVVGTVVGISVGHCVGGSSVGAAPGRRQPAKSAVVRTNTAIRILYFFIVNLLKFLDSPILFPTEGLLIRKNTVSEQL